MPDIFPADSVGLVVPQLLAVNKPLMMDCGVSLPAYELVYETYGSLNADKSNAVLICHALSGDHHAAGFHHVDDKKVGWWDVCIGPTKPIDTRYFFVVCLNNLGSCKGSTGPVSINPATGKLYGPDFPIVTVRDWVRSQAALADALGVQQWAAVVGGSLGGMQALQWAIEFPERVRHCVAIAAAPRLSAQNIAFNEVARQAILNDPDFHGGRYQEYGTVPRLGLMLARMLGHITYLSEESMREKFGRVLREGKLNFGFDVDFEVESYLRYQGRSFVERFDANTYLLMTKALDYFDPAREFGHDLAAAFQQVLAKFFILSFSTDWRFSAARSREIVKALLDSRKAVTYVDVEADQGHDSFLMPIPYYLQVFKAYMDRVAQESSL